MPFRAVTTSRVLALLLLCFVLAKGHRAVAQTTAATHLQVVVGTGAAGVSDGSALQASFLMPGALAFGPDGTLYVADTAAQRIRAVSGGGYVRTVAGGGEMAASGLWVDGGFRDGPALQARFFRPSGLAVDRDGSIYVADTFNHCIRLIRGGIVSTVAGKCGTAGSSDGPPGISLMQYPRGLALSTNGTLYIADEGNGIRGLDRNNNLATYQFPAALNLKNATGISAIDTPAETYLFIADQNQLVRYATKSFTLQRSTVLFGFGLQAGHPYAVAALNPSSVVYTDLLDGSVRYTESFAPTPPDEQFHAQYIGATPTVNAPLGITGRRGGFSAPMGVAVRDGRMAIADAIQRKVFVETLSDQRRIYNTSVGAFESASPRTYRIAVQGNSFLWYATGFSDSIPGQLEKDLNDSGAAGRTLRVTPLVEPCPDAEILSSGVTDYAILIVNSFLTYCTGEFFQNNMVTQSPGPWQQQVRDRLKTVVSALNAAHVPVLLVLIPFPIEVAANENLYSVEDAGRYPFAPPDSPVLTSDYSAAEKNWLETLNGTGAPVLNLFPAIREYERKPHSDSLYGTGDFHPSAAGRRLMAQALAAYLERMKPWHR